MNAAACSWRVRTNSIDDWRTESRKSMFSSPGTPKMRSTPSSSKALPMTSDPRCVVICPTLPRIRGRTHHLAHTEAAPPARPHPPRRPRRTHLAPPPAPTSHTQPHTPRRGGPVHPADTAPEATTGDDRLKMKRHSVHTTRTEGHR